MLEDLANVGELIGAIGVIVTVGQLASERVQAILGARPGLLSKKLARSARERADVPGFEADRLGLSPDAAGPTSP